MPAAKTAVRQSGVLKKRAEKVGGKYQKDEPAAG